MKTDQIRKAIDEIESELRRLGRWKSEPIAPEKFDDMGAFGMNTMSPEEWLQFVLVPRVRGLLANGGSFPGNSQVGVWAARNFDGDEDASQLVSLLSSFDKLF